MRGLFCVVLFIFILNVVSLAKTIHITTNSDFVNFIVDGNFDDDIVLEIDLDFDDDELKSVIDKLPLGIQTGTECTPYSGTFDGGKHHVKNLQLLDRPISGLICIAREAVVKNLVVDDTCVFSGDIAGGIIVNVTGNITIENVHVYGTITSKNFGGGIIGSVHDLSDAFVIVERSGFHGTLFGAANELKYNYHGGLIGYVKSCLNSTFLFSESVNNGTIDTSPISLLTVHSTNNVGGFVGYFTSIEKMNIVVSDCINNAQIIHIMPNDTSSSYVGGSFGYLYGTEVKIEMKNNINSAIFNCSIKSSLSIGGYIGSMTSNNGTLIMNNNTNDGVMSLISNSLNAGGLVGYFKCSEFMDIVLQLNTNYGNIHRESRNDNSGLVFGGLIGFLSFERSKVFRVCNNVNYANLSFLSLTKNSYIGGFIGEIQGSSISMVDYQINFTDNTNNGDIYANGSETLHMGGFVAYIKMSAAFGEIFFENNINNGNMSVSTNVSSNNWNVGGIVGFFSVTFNSKGYYQNYFISNTNNGNIIAAGPVLHHIGGCVGYFVQYESGGILIRSNTNNGEISCICDHEKDVKIGGFAGSFECSGSKHNQTNLVGNINEGNIYVESNSSSTHSVAGFIGDCVLSSSSDLNIWNNLNNGNIYDSCCPKLRVGSLFGTLAQSKSGSIRFNNNTNYGNLHFDGNDGVSSDNGLLGGFVGDLSKSSALTIMTDNANYGDVISHCGQRQVKICGFVCGQKISFQNCINNANMKGAFVYGIADVVTKANNIVSVGTLNGTSESYSFWKSATEIPSAIYGMKDKCANCDGNVTLFAKDSSDGKLRILDENKQLVNSLLNSEADKNGYELRWDNNLYLTKPVTITIGSPLNVILRLPNGSTMEDNEVSDKILKYHLFVKGETPSPPNEYTKTKILDSDAELVPYYLITIDGEIKRTHYLKADGDHTIGESINELKEYLESKYYTVGDKDSSMVLNEKSKIKGDMNIIVMVSHQVAIDMEKDSVRAADVDIKDVVESISALCGVDAGEILVVIETDNDGYVLRVILVLKSEEQSEIVADSVNNMIQSKGQQCPYGVICRAREARVIVIQSQVLSGNERHFNSNVMFALLFVLFLCVMK